MTATQWQQRQQATGQALAIPQVNDSYEPLQIVFQAESRPCERSPAGKHLPRQPRLNHEENS